MSGNLQSQPPDEGSDDAARPGAESRRGCCWALAPDVPIPAAPKASEAEPLTEGAS
jgi:hypothetical protein